MQGNTSRETTGQNTKNDKNRGTTNSKGHKNTEVGQIKSEQVFNAGKSLNCNKCKDDEGLRNKNT